MSNLDLKDKKVAILGMGIEGLALVCFLSDKECKISVLDMFLAKEIENRLLNEERAKFLQIMQNDKIKKVFGDNYLDNLKSFDIIFRSPGISFLNPKIQEAKESGVLVSSQIKLFFELCPCKIIGVTGTKGKGTTASLIFEILKKKLETRNSKLEITALAGSRSECGTNPNVQNSKPLYDIRNTSYTNIYLAGNIGYPAISLISNLKINDIVILELSSFQLMDLEKSPHITVVTNLFVDHLDYHEDVGEYRSAKESVIKFQNKEDFAVLNSKSTFNNDVISNARSQIKYFSSEKGLDSRTPTGIPDLRGNDDGEIGNDKKENIDNKIDAVVKNGEVILDPEKRNIKICDKNSIELFGNHNLENIAAATLVADILGVDEEIIKNTVLEFKGLPHRIEFVATISGVKYVNDSFATNPEPTMAAINSFAEDKVLILGGSSKGADFSALAQKITDSNVKGVVLIGDEADKIEQALIMVSYSGRIIKGFSDIKEIVESASKLSSDNNVVILSPACASFGLFKNYKDRGEQFKAAVLKLQSQISNESS